LRSIRHSPFWQKQAAKGKVNTSITRSVSKRLNKEDVVKALEEAENEDSVSDNDASDNEERKYKDF
jgi:hypothetical protein